MLREFKRRAIYAESLLAYNGDGFSEVKILTEHCFDVACKNGFVLRQVLWWISRMLRTENTNSI